MSEFNIVDCLVQGLDVPTDIGRTSVGTGDKFWSDAFLLAPITHIGTGGS